MKQKELMKDLGRAAQEMGKRLEIRSRRSGFYLSTEGGRLHLGPAVSDEVNPKRVRRYYKALGLLPSAPTIC